MDRTLPVVIVLSRFFFSSRRRHTRCYRDWSSDVCSSDLTLTADFRHICRAGEMGENRPPEMWQALDLEFHDFDLLTKEVLLALRSFLAGLRSEERRVGKEGRGRSGLYWFIELIKYRR